MGDETVDLPANVRDKVALEGTVKHLTDRQFFPSHKPNRVPDTVILHTFVPLHQKRRLPYLQ